MKIRPACTVDMKAMVSLLGELFEIEDDFAFHPGKQKRGLELLLESPDALLLVAETKGEVVAMATMQRLVSTAEGGYVGLIEDVVVTRAHRGEGIGTMLLETLIAEAQRTGLKRLALGSDCRNAPALAFYERYAFRQSRMGLLYRLLPREENPEMPPFRIGD